MTPDSFLKGQLALLAWKEGHQHGGLDNMLAVAFVVRNRIKAGWHGGDWSAAIANHQEYSAEHEAPCLFVHTLPDVRDANVRTLLQRIDDIFMGMAVDRMTDSALYYAELNKVTRNWFSINILGNLQEHPMVAQVGPVAFFR